jgi:RNA polymerase sigma factor (sigma-70 family)
MSKRAKGSPSNPKPGAETVPADERAKSIPSAPGPSTTPDSATMWNPVVDDDLSRVLEEAQNGNQTAWETLFKECYPKVRRVVRLKLNRSMRSLFDSTDFASDVMGNLVANLDRLKFPSVDSLLAFLAQVAEQKVIDEHRRRHTLNRDAARHQPLLASDPDDGPIQLPSDGPIASPVAQAHEVHRWLLERPDETERSIIELRQLGYSASEIAEQTGWDVRKVQRFLKQRLDSLSRSGIVISVNRFPHSPGPGYPLLGDRIVSVAQQGQEVTLRIKGIPPSLLFGTGENIDAALQDLGQRLHTLDQTHRSTPPHLRSRESEEVISVLSDLVDWDQYEAENPLVQPAWGRLDEIGSGSHKIHWVIGPRGENDTAGILRSGEIPASLTQMSKGQWFYGTIRSFPDRIEWVEQPHAVPDPDDPEARRELWESLPKVFADQDGCWPLKRK